jgi:hypothetical protein
MADGVSDALASGIDPNRADGRTIPAKSVPVIPAE